MVYTQINRHHLQYIFLFLNDEAWDLNSEKDTKHVDICSKYNTAFPNLHRDLIYYWKNHLTDLQCELARKRKHQKLTLTNKHKLIKNTEPTFCKDDSHLISRCFENSYKWHRGPKKPPFSFLPSQSIVTQIIQLNNPRVSIKSVEKVATTDELL